MVNSVIKKDINGRDYIARDQERFENLKNDGWICIRTIRWSEYLSYSNEVKKKFLEDLKNSILEAKVLENVYKSRKEIREEQKQAERKLREELKKNKILSTKVIKQSKISKKEIENQEKLKYYLDNNIQIDKSGKFNPSKYEEAVWEERLKLLEKYDKSKFGWISSAIKETGLSKGMIYRTCKHFNIKFRTKKF